MSGEKSRLVILDEWHGKYKITNEMYQSIANELVKSYEHLKYVPVASILFIENTEGKAKRQNKLQYATISKIPEKWSDILYQTTGRRFQFMFELQKENIENFSWEQVVMVLYRELRKINRDGDIIAYDIEEFNEIAYNVGTDWDEKNRVIPNLIEAKGNWERMKQPRLFEPEEIINSRSRQMQ